ncbi:retrovirus-related pol polyprotein from transposon TNT 1-94 [Tanacetum coccineum]
MNKMIKMNKSSSIPLKIHQGTTLRWSKDQHIKLVNIIGNPGKGMLTRSMAAKLTADSANECLFADFLSEIEPKKLSEVFRNKKDEHGTTIKNKARLVAQGYSQEEGIDYDETFAPRAKMDAIRIFLAFATYLNIIVYKMDMKSDFLNGKLKEEVYVKQPLGFESSEYPDYVCKLEKALYGIKQAPKAWYETLSTFLLQNKFVKGRIDNTLFMYNSKGDVLLVQDNKGISICQEQYTGNLLQKYEISDSSSIKTPMVPPNNLRPHLAGKPVNETLYRGMIGSLMYLTAIRPDIKFSTVLCCLGFDLKGYSDSDYAGCNMDRKSTLGSCQILGGKLVYWSVKKQQSVAMGRGVAYDFAGCWVLWQKPYSWMKSQPVTYGDIILRLYHFIKDHILKGDIELHFIPIEYQLADIFTKPLDEPTFTRLKA